MTEGGGVRVRRRSASAAARLRVIRVGPKLFITPAGCPPIRGISPDEITFLQQRRLSLVLFVTWLILSFCQPDLLTVTGHVVSPYLKERIIVLTNGLQCRPG